MKKQSNLSLICSLLCAAGSLVLAAAELFNTEVSVPRRTFHVFLALASCSVWTATLVLNLLQRKAEAGTEPEQLNK